MILPRGITGFDVPSGHPGTDLRGLTGDCWQFAAPRKGRVGPVSSPEPATNFVTLTITLPDRQITLLANQIHPWLAFSATPQLACPFIHFDHPRDLIEHLTRIGRYHIPTVQQLETPATESACAGLGPSERRQLAYWTRAYGDILRVGGLVFNLWD